MKPKSILIIAVSLLMGLAANAFACGEADYPNCTPGGDAITRQFVSKDYDGWLSTDIWDLPHGSYFTWGIDWDLPTNETIVTVTEAKLTFNSLWDNSPSGSESVLHTNLLDLSASDLSGTTYRPAGGDYTSRLAAGNDIDGIGNGDQFAGLGVTDLEDFTNITKNYNDRSTLVYFFSQEELDAFNTYLTDGVFGLGIDPDCHFQNNGVVLSITAICEAPGGNDPAPVPEPATMLLLGTGLIGLAGSRSRRKK